MFYNTKLAEKYATQFLKESGCIFPSRLWNNYIQFYKNKVIKGKKDPEDRISFSHLSGFFYLARMATKFKGFSKLLSYDKKNSNPFGRNIPDGIKDYGVLLDHSPKQVTRYLKEELRFINVKGYEYLRVQKKQQNGESDEDFNKRMMGVCLKRVDEYINKQRNVRAAKLKKVLKLYNDLITATVYQSILNNRRTGKNTEAQIKRLHKITVDLEQWSWLASKEAGDRLDKLKIDREKKEQMRKEKRNLQE